jgi:hypothetical protein
MVFKYSSEGKYDLCEPVMLAGKPGFLKYDSKTEKVIVPPSEENYPAYAPYEFDTLEEANNYLDRARKETPGSL